MTQPPPEPDDSPRRPESVDWDAFIGRPEAQPVEAQGAEARGAQPISRRDLREAQNRETRSDRRARLSVQPPREKRARSGAWGCLVALLVLVALAAGAVAAAQGPISQLVAGLQGPADYTGDGTTEIVFMIHDGESGQDIAQALADQDVVKSFEAIYGLLRRESPEPVFQPGAYQLSTKMSARSALDALTDPANKLEQTVVVPEGTAAAVVYQLISEGTSLPLAEITAAAADVASFGLPAEATSLEGFLFPATYTFPPEVTARDALTTLVERQFQALDGAGVAPGDRWRTVVLAALIQREAGLKDDFYRVSRVFLNRLDPAQWASGLLQSDASVAYGTGKTNLVTTTDAERADATNPYNTYANPGLPAGPISNPGDLAIDAALHPADGSWLFFVTWNLDTGETIFSTTGAEHEAGVAKWQAWMRENPGFG